MGLADFFRPKYRHSDVKVRLEAVRALTSDEADILATVAKSDKDPGVRRIAIEKLERVELLAELAESESDRGNRDLAGSRAAELWVQAACQDEDETLAADGLSGLLKLGDPATEQKPTTDHEPLADNNLAPAETAAPRTKPRRMAGNDGSASPRPVKQHDDHSRKTGNE